MIPQSCPNCQTVHDVSVYVTGQRLLCKCGIRFEVRRTDVSSAPRGRAQLPTVVEGQRTPKPATAASAVSAVSAAEPSEPIEISRAAGLPPPPVDSQLAAASPAGGEAPITGLERTAIRSNAAPANGAAEEDVGETFLSSQAQPVQIPGYELQEVLGRGGMGEVWRAWQKSLGRMVAIKILPDKLAKDPEFVARFEKEATALAALSHPNIIQIIDRGVAGASAYFVMEYVPGKSLRDLMNGRKLVPQDALKLVAQICRAIDYAHEQKIIHRDLKPENILVDERGHVKVADFGLAGFRGGDSKHNLTATQVAMGTLNYMAPEQRRDAKNVDGRADLYSLGVILYEMLTGELPVGRFKLPSEKDGSLDPRVDEIVERSLESEPEARYQRASEIGAQVESLIQTASSFPGMMTPGSSPRAGSSPRTEPVTHRSVIEKGWSGLRTGLMVIGVLAIVGVAIKVPIFSGNSSGAVAEGGGRGPSTFPPNTEKTLHTDVAVDPKPNGALSLRASFGTGSQALNAHAGNWRVENGKLVADQAGNVISKGAKLVPRTYLSQRYFSSDELAAEVEVSYRELDYDTVLEEGHQHYAELSYRVKDVQVSVFAIPEVGMRLLWRYYAPSGSEVVGNSARDIDGLVEDEAPVPPEGQPFKIKLVLRKQKDGTLAEAYLNGERFARKLLRGMSNQTAKIALGCRNLHCEFDELAITGLVKDRPSRQLAEGPGQ